jgi:hypothetical protein
LAFFRRGDDRPAPAPAPVDAGPPPEERPEVLAEETWKIIRQINAAAGRLPNRATVEARGITDTLRDIIGTSAVRPLDVYTLVALRGIVYDYLPTTLQRFLSLDRALHDVPRPSGKTPVQSLEEQLASLQDAADRVLEAIRAEDVDAVMTQGNFLQTKFTASDLDL